VKVLHVVGAFWPAVRYGGPIVSVKELCKAIQKAGVTLDVATTDADGSERSPVDTSQWTEVEGLRVRYFRRMGRSNFVFSPGLASNLLAIAGDYDLIHITSTFQFPSSIAGVAARRVHTPYLVSPRGSLQEWSLRQKRWKKWPYWHLTERRHLLGADALHATADLEAAAIRDCLGDRPIIVVPNGVDPIPVPDVARKTRQIVFLGRLHPKKGLDILVAALSLVTRRWPDLEAIVAGPDEANEWARVSEILDRLQPKPRVRYVGSVFGIEKHTLLAESTVFVLPSHSENFGQAVVEALACGTPVIVSRNCPWQSVERVGAGYWIANTAEEVAGALERILGNEQLQKSMGKAAREHAKDFSWQAAGDAMAAYYERLLSNRGRSGRPA